MSVLPAPRLARLAAVGVAPALLAPFVPGAAAAWLAFWILLALAAAADAALLPRLDSLEAERELPVRWHLGSETAFGLRLRHGLAHGIALRLRDDWPESFAGEREAARVQVGPGAAALVRQTARPGARGRHEFGAVHAEASGPLGLWLRRARLPAPGAAPVYPDWTPGRAALEQAALAAREGLRRVPRRGEGTEFESLREYRPGDALARIDWKATARRGFAVSRLFQVERNHDLVLALDCGRLMGARFEGVPKFEHALRAAIALAEAGVRQGDRVGFLAFDERPLAWVPPGKGPAQVGAILGAAYALQSRLAESEPGAALEHLAARHRKSSLVVVMTDFLDREAAQPLIAAMLGIAARHRLLFVAVQDPTLEELLARPAQSAHDAYAQAVCHAMRSERRAVLAALEQRGISVLDLPPDRLTAPVINRYLELRFAAAV